MYDLSAFSEEMDTYDTYPTLARYLSLGPVQAALGVIRSGERTPKTREHHNASVSTLHILAGDHVRRTDLLLPRLIEAGVEVLVYVGTLDFSCGFRAAGEMIASRNLVTAKIPEELKDWNVGSGRYICSTNARRKGIGRFCYLEIDGTGHGVAYEYDGWVDVFEKWILQGSV